MLGDGATYSSLICSFEKAGYQEYADFVKHLLREATNATNKNDTDHSRPSCPSSTQQNEVFPDIKDKAFLHQLGK